jgi:hypothetical protein
MVFIIADCLPVRRRFEKNGGPKNRFAVKNHRRRTRSPFSIHTSPGL